MILHRYQIDAGRTELELPEGHAIVHFGHRLEDNARIFQVWAIVPDHWEDVPKETVTLRVVKSGTRAAGHYVGTTLVHVMAVGQQPFPTPDTTAWHLFDITKRGGVSAYGDLDG